MIWSLHRLETVSWTYIQHDLAAATSWLTVYFLSVQIAVFLIERHFLLALSSQQGCPVCPKYQGSLQVCLCTSCFLHLENMQIFPSPTGQEVVLALWFPSLKRFNPVVVIFFRWVSSQDNHRPGIQVNHMKRRKGRILLSAWEFSGNLRTSIFCYTY